MIRMVSNNSMKNIPRKKAEKLELLQARIPLETKERLTAVAGARRQSLGAALKDILDRILPEFEQEAAAAFSKGAKHG